MLVATEGRALRLRGIDLWVEDSGAGSRCVVFAHGLFWDTRLFAPQIETLRSNWRCVAYDHRGQGRSERPPGAYDIDTLTDDAIALIEHLNAGPVHFVGLSMGGFVGLRVALKRPDLLASLALLNTSAEPEPAAHRWRNGLLRIAARCFGIAAVSGWLMPLMFGAAVRADPTRAAELAGYRARINAHDLSAILKAVDAVLTRAGLSAQLPQIATPTLIIAGDQDRATPPATSEAMRAALPNARLTVLADTGHSSTLESPAAVNAALADFLSTIDSRTEPPSSIAAIEDQSSPAS